MYRAILNKNALIFMLTCICLPLIVMVWLSWYDNNDSLAFSWAGYRELFVGARLSELTSITVRAFLVSISSTFCAFWIAIFLTLYADTIFRMIFLLVATLPFLINESIRAFSWQHIFARNGILNSILSFFAGHSITPFDATNNTNVYVVMILTCIPFGIFILSAALSTLPVTHFKVASDLKLNFRSRLVRVIVPGMRTAIFSSLLVVFFISFSLSAEVNYLGGDTKTSTRNLVLSLMSASKFQSIFSLGTLMLFLLIGMLLALNAAGKLKKS